MGSRSGGGLPFGKLLIAVVAVVGFLASLVAVLEFTTGSTSLSDLLGDDEEATQAPNLSDLPPAEVSIAAPVDGKKVAVTTDADGRARFEVFGSSSWIAQDRRIVLLVKPVDPPAAQWYAYSDVTIDADGTWNAHAWYGEGELAVTRGNTFDLQAVVTNTAPPQTVNAPGELPLLAQSSVLRLEIGQVD